MPWPRKQATAILLSEKRRGTPRSKTAQEAKASLRKPKPKRTKR